MSSSLFLAFLFTLFACCATSQRHFPPVSNACNCQCGSGLASVHTKTEETECVTNATLQASIKKLRNDLRATTNDPGNYDLLFAVARVSEYAIIHDLSHNLSALTISLWVRTTYRKSLDAALVSYATSDSKNDALLLRGLDTLRFVVDEEERVTTMKLNDGEWHHVVFTWESAGGAWQGYLDGRLVDSGAGFKKGAVISHNGTLVLGQEQDKVGGGFEYSQSYVGLMSKVNLWNRVLSGDELLTLNKDPKSGLHGNVLKWDHSWLMGIRGWVRIMRPSSCRF